MATHSRLLPGESHGQRSLAEYSPQGHKKSNMTEWLNPRHTIPQPGIEPSPSAVRAQSPNHWTARELPHFTNLLKIERGRKMRGVPGPAGMGHRDVGEDSGSRARKWFGSASELASRWSSSQRWGVIVVSTEDWLYQLLCIHHLEFPRYFREFGVIIHKFQMGGKTQRSQATPSDSHSC